ncbi:N-acetylglucosaminyl-phosphatidylinositol de-N-acetylase [Trichoplax sp. H2]|nr:N-acetylglucosaminyl-phosphatidylinositol de-N-acetylase [Trichoplax sp. H2]|eukprot:RDD40741.1 N-acetylglucosaminyl-phosphatidylinositol de-N-acetylase [Trichoplax sp. H2]
MDGNISYGLYTFIVKIASTSVFQVSLLIVVVMMLAYHSTNLNDWCTVVAQKNVLLVIAHPDDECMFFSPCAQAMAKYAENVYLLCISDGDYHGMGKIRPKELIKSCKFLGIDRIEIIFNKFLQDDPNANWDKKLLKKIFRDRICQHRINVIVTFDEYGVSGHANHISLYHALNELIHEESDDCIAQIEAFALKSVNVIRKYIGIMDIIWTILLKGNSYVCINSFGGCIASQLAMRAHASQFVWFRRLYVIFSRYMLINTLERIG